MSDGSIVVDGSHVFPISNISHFGTGSIDKFHISWLFVLTVFVLWAVFVPVAMGMEFATGGSGVFLILVAVFSTVWLGPACWNIMKPKYEGLLLTANSGDWFLFETRDVRGIRDVAWSVRQIVDMGQGSGSSGFSVTITNSHIDGDFLAGRDISKQQAIHSPPPPTAAQRVNHDSLPDLDLTAAESVGAEPFTSRPTIGER